ncbi:MAG: cation:proton antiporter, partial [Erysipelotrichaceae bacterium]|nr:cation:proton antiporter [Erysipelotrichaceae bacterium]
MLLSFAMILVSGLLAGWMCQKMRIPSLFGMIIAGILIGPYMGNLIDASVLEMSASLRRIALIIILIRAGLKLDFDDLKKVGRSAILMCFVPATLEIVGMILLAPRFLGLSVLESAILGSVIAAVSPAVVVPRMIKLIDEGYGVNESIPQMILAGTSVDDVYVIVVFTALTSLATGQSVSIMSFVNIPLSIVIGVIFGLVVGTILIRFFKQMKVRLVVQIALMMSLSFILNTFEDQFPFIPFASLIAIMCMGMAIKRSDSAQAKLLSVSYDQLWVVAEVFLFVLVGASVAINSLYRTG